MIHQFVFHNAILTPQSRNALYDQLPVAKVTAVPTNVHRPPKYWQSTARGGSVRMATAHEPQEKVLARPIRNKISVGISVKVMRSEEDLNVSHYQDETGGATPDESRGEAARESTWVRLVPTEVYIFLFYLLVTLFLT